MVAEPAGPAVPGRERCPADEDHVGGQADEVVGKAEADPAEPAADQVDTSRPGQPWREPRWLEPLRCVGGDPAAAAPVCGDSRVRGGQEFVGNAGGEPAFLAGTGRSE